MLTRLPKNTRFWEQRFLDLKSLFTHQQTAVVEPIKQPPPLQWSILIAVMVRAV
jgi:hypothetical protein